MDLQIGLQLYSIKDATEKDFIGTLRKVAQIGYKGVEFAGYGGLASCELKALLDELGLKACGSHVALDLLQKDIEGVIDYCLTIGCEYVVFPWAAYESKEDYEKMAVTLSEIGQKLKSRGLSLAYHNHGHELEEFQGKYGLDIIYEGTDPEILRAEIDTYWVKYAGIDPVEYIKKYSGRCDLLHLKDMEVVDGVKRTTSIGDGSIDIKAIIKAGKDQGTKWFIVEQEHFKESSLKCVETGYKNLVKLIED